MENAPVRVHLSILLADLDAIRTKWETRDPELIKSVQIFKTFLEKDRERKDGPQKDEDR